MTKKRIYRFKPREGKRLSKEQATRYGEYLYAMGKRRKRGVKPEELVALAQWPDNPCHDAFQWDDDSAAQEFRLIQARTLLRSIVVVYGEGDSAIEDIAFHRVTVSGRRKDEVTHAYVPVEQVVREPESLSYIAEEWNRRIRAMARDLKMHETFAERFSGVVEALEGAAEKMEELVEV